jgi:hypothetical protein
MQETRLGTAPRASTASASLGDLDRISACHCSAEMIRVRTSRIVRGLRTEWEALRVEFWDKLVRVDWRSLVVQGICLELALRVFHC